MQTTFMRLFKAGKLNTVSKFFTALRAERDTGTGTTTERFLGTLIDTPKFDAPERLKEPEQYFTKEHVLRQWERADWQQTDIRIRAFTAQLIETARRQGIPLYPHSAFRTQAQQDELFNKGRSRAKWPRAPHAQGKAVDIVHSRYHWEMTRDEWSLLGVIGKQIALRMGIQIEWGGDWRFYDPAHWELADWRNDVVKRPTLEPVRKTPRFILRNEQYHKNK